MEIVNSTGIINTLDKKVDEAIDNEVKLIEHIKNEKYSDNLIYNYLIKLNGEIFLTCDNKMYIYDNLTGLWSDEKQKFNEYIRNFKLTLKVLRNKLSKQATEENKTSIEQEIKNLSTIILNLETEQRLEKLEKHIKRQTNNDEIKNKFNSVYLNGIMFEDGLFDFAINDIRVAKKEEYFIKHIGYKYPEKKSKSALKELNTMLLDTLFEDEETKLYVLKVLSSCLVGMRQYENFYIFTGQGRNGKGCIDALIRNTMGNFYQSCDMANFTVAKKSQNEANSTLAQAQGKRLLMATEPEDNEKLLISRLKQFTGGDAITTRQLYGTSFSYVPQFTIILQTNAIPELSKLDKAIQRRLRIINFPFEFVDEPKNKSEKKAQPDLKTKYCNSDKWRDAFILLLIDTYITHIKDDTKMSIDMPESVKRQCDEYIEENNYIMPFINDNYDYKTANKTDKNHWHLVSKITNNYNSQNSKTQQTSKNISSILKLNKFEFKLSHGYLKFLLGEEKDKQDINTEDE